MDWLTLLAILLSPIIAIQVQKWSETYKEKRDRQLSIFKTLMATRSERVSFEHVRALNMIDIEFYGKTKITNAWKVYLDCLNEPTTNDNKFNIWVETRDTFFIELLNEMAQLLDYDFDKVHLKKAIYFPKAHGDEIDYQHYIRETIKKVFSGEISIPVSIKNPTSKNDDCHIN